MSTVVLWVISGLLAGISVIACGFAVYYATDAARTSGRIRRSR